MDGDGLRGLDDAVLLLRNRPRAPARPSRTPPCSDELHTLCRSIPAANAPGALASLIRTWRAPDSPRRRWWKP